MNRLRSGAAVAAILALAFPLAACTATTATSSSGVATASDELWDRTKLHTIALTVDPDKLTEALETYASSSEKVWITASVTIDGETFDNVGMKLKGNSSLRGVSADSAPEALPWIIRLDKFVKGQNLDGETELVVRGNSSDSSLNEAVALTMLDEAGLASEQAIATSFSVNDSDHTLRLTIQNPNDGWTADNFDADTLLWKSDAQGTWDYVDDDPASYLTSFDQEAGTEDYTPLISFLKFINESDDATFASDLDQYLDVDAFATYLAFQDLVSNMDDIDGPGNNSYLAYSPDTALMTVVNWDLNLAFGMSPGGGGAEGGRGGFGGAAPDGTAPNPGQAPTGMPGGAPGERPTDMPTDFPADMQRDMPEGDMPAGGFGGGMGGGMGGGGMGGNILAERFQANDDFAALVATAKTDLTETLVDSGDAQRILDEWSAVLTEQAGDLIDADTVSSDAEKISSSLAGTK